MNKKLYQTTGFFAIVMIVLMQSCSSPDKAPEVATEADSTETVIEQPDTVLFWTVNAQDKIKSRVYKDTAAISEPVSVINGINSIYPAVKLKFVKLSGDTAYAHIDSAFALTNDMGSFGATEYLSTVVINLTTLPTINFVNLDFQEGSHASPGVFAKSNYQSYKEKD